jgi:hypothetical protein
MNNNNNSKPDLHDPIERCIAAFALRLLGIGHRQLRGLFKSKHCGKVL